MSRSFSDLGNDLYTGRRSVAFVASAAALVRRLRRPRSSWRCWAWRSSGSTSARVPGRRRSSGSPRASAPQDYEQTARQAVGAAEDQRGVIVTPRATTPSGSRPSALSDTDSQDVRASLAEAFDVPAQDVSATFIGPSWGASVSQQALTALVGLPLRVVVLFIWAYFREWKMSVAALVALAHDVFITVGVYALSRLRGHPGHRDRLPDRSSASRSTTPSSSSTRCARTPTEALRERADELRARPPTSPSTRRWSARSTPRSSALLPDRRRCSSSASIYLGSGRAARPRARPVRRHGSPARTPRSSSPPRSLVHAQAPSKRRRTRVARARASRPPGTQRPSVRRGLPAARAAGEAAPGGAVVGAGQPAERRGGGHRSPGAPSDQYALARPAQPADASAPKSKR